MSQNSELIYWLALINDSGLKLSRVKPIIQRWCVVEKRPLAELFDLSPLDWSTTFGLSAPEARQALLAGNKLDQQAALLKKWQAQGIQTLTRIDPRYPPRLAQALPPVQQPLLVWAQGALDLLPEPGVAMLGSQAPDEAGARFIDELTNALVVEGIGLISGFGRGLDRATLEKMLTMPGGRAVVVLPMGLSAFAQTTSKLTPAVKSSQVALVSPFAPETQYQDKLAEARNLLIDYLALALLIPHTDEAAQARAVEALGRGLPVFVGLTDTAAHRTLIDQGALLLTDAGEVVEMV
ncbi:MAG: DNA-processing protein DprA, partial [Chloroflexota bacterium]